jgi:anti-anti-sigma factor
MTQKFGPRRRPRAIPPNAGVLFDLLQVAVSEPRPGVLVVAPSGEVDVATSAVLRDAALDAVKAGPRCVAVDLSTLTFCGSRGLVVLLECLEAARATGIGFGVLGGLPIVRRVLQITGLGPVLSHSDTLDQLLAAEGIR